MAQRILKEGSKRQDTSIERWWFPSAEGQAKSDGRPTAKGGVCWWPAAERRRAAAPPADWAALTSPAVKHSDWPKSRELGSGQGDSVVF